MAKPILIILLLACTRLTLCAQLCQGSLGDPIVNISFGSGANPGAPIAAAGTGYQYVATDCPNDGSYTIRNNSFGCFGSSWHNVSGDHTGNSNGYFMLVNASIQPSAFYLDTVRGLCANSTYEFAAWLLNVANNSNTCSGNSILPNLTFRIEKTDGTLLQFYNTNNIPILDVPTWKQYGFFFTTPVGTPDIVLRILNNAGGGCGNDIALDDITFRPCGPLITPSIAGQPVNRIDLCEGMQGQYSLSCTVSGGFTDPTYQWQQNTDNGPWTDIPGENTTNLSVNVPSNTLIGIYAFRLAVAENGNLGSPQCRIVSMPLTIAYNANPSTTASNDGPVCKNSDVVLSATGGSTYNWSGPASYSANGSQVTIENIQPPQEGKYFVTVTNAAGCTKIDSTIVTLKPSPTASVGFTEAGICAGDSVQLFATGGDAYEWIPATGLSSATDPGPYASPSQSLLYTVVVTNAPGCTDSAFVDIRVSEEPRADAGPDQTLIVNQGFVNLSATAQGTNLDYHWTPSPYLSDINSLEPKANPPVSTQFIFNVSSRDGCGDDTDTMKVIVFNDVYIPNSFTPNGDGVNDNWHIPALNAYKNFDLAVFNRYGQKVFYLRNQNKSWDGTFNGKRLPVGVYVYLLDLKTAMEPLKGTVLIIR